eukprot:5464946-Pleurochrysis_carterae.AAC.2
MAPHHVPSAASAPCVSTSNFVIQEREREHVAFAQHGRPLVRAHAQICEPFRAVVRHPVAAREVGLAPPILHDAQQRRGALGVVQHVLRLDVVERLQLGVVVVLLRVLHRLGLHQLLVRDVAPRNRVPHTRRAALHELDFASPEPGHDRADGLLVARDGDGRTVVRRLLVVEGAAGELAGEDGVGALAEHVKVVKGGGGGDVRCRVDDERAARHGERRGACDR